MGRPGHGRKLENKKINGYVADYVIKDMDNDGKPEIALARFYLLALQ
jgi:hypothetical protein